MQTQIQALLVVMKRVTGKPNTGSNIEVAKLPVFSRKTEKVGGFIMGCRLYLKIKMRKVMVEKWIQWILSYMQGGSADV